MIHRKILCPENAGLPTPVEVVVCMGDTLAHLRSLQTVERLIRLTHTALRPGGRLVLSFRDGTTLPSGDQRFLPIRSQSDRIFTCFLEEIDHHHVRVHDILHVRHDDVWTQRVSSYIKLRLHAAAIDEMLRTCGFDVRVVTEQDGQVLRVLAAS